MTEDLLPYLKPARYVDSDHPAVVAFAQRVAGSATTARDIAVRLFQAVRDDIRYDPYRIELAPAGLTASRCLTQGYGFCVPKAALYAAALRVHGIPARLCFADVKNHLTSARLRQTMGTDLFVYHGYAEVLLPHDTAAPPGQGLDAARWLKATPTFNRSLCERAGTLPLEFDGTADSIFHPFDAAGRRHMEYVREHGAFADLPREPMLAAWDAVYPPNADWKRSTAGADFEADVQRVAH